VTELRKRMIEDLRLRGLAESTQRSYLHYVTEYARYFRTSPDRLDLEAVRQFQLYLTAERKLSAEAYNAALAALKFLYLVTLEMPWRDEDFPKRQRVKVKVPTVLSRPEVRQFFRHVTGIRNRTIVMLCYGAGLRIQEAVELKVSNVDSARMVLHIENGKGKKARMVKLSPALLAVLRAYWRATRPGKLWLFPGWRNHGCVSQSSVQQACRDAWEQAGMSKRVTPHLLRHSFATHLLESGEDVRVIQTLLGHSQIDTTARYAAVTPGRLAKVPGTLDTLHQPTALLTPAKKRGRPRKDTTA
jgi:integrase/recombinase XerD